MASIATVALVAMFGAAGGLMRLGAVTLATRWTGGGFPWGTLAVNLGGCAAIGAGAALAMSASPLLWSALATGLLGSFTTVSAFALQVVALARAGRRRRAAAYAALSLALCPLAAAGGHALVAG